jgi:hypothetical protein
MALGRTVHTNLGTGPALEVSYDGQVQYSPPLTLDWSTVAAVSGSDVTLNDGTIIPIGSKYLRYGQVITLITTGGKYGPYDDEAADGRQTLTQGNVYILNRTLVYTSGIGSAVPQQYDPEHIGAIQGGFVWHARLLVHATTASLADGPTLATLLAVMPEIHPVYNR